MGSCYTLINKNDIPTRKAWQSAINDAGFDLKLGDKLKPFNNSEEHECTLNGEFAYIDVYYSDIDEFNDVCEGELSGEFLIAATDKNYCVNFYFHELEDCASAMIAAYVLGKNFNAIVSFDGKEVTPDAQALETIQRILQLTQTEYSVIPDDIAKYITIEKSNVYGGVLATSVFILVGFYIMFVATIYPQYKKWESNNWHKTPSVILKSKADTSGNNSTFKLLYRYEHKAKSYESSQYDFTIGNTGTDDELRSLAKKHPVGKTVACYVNPDDPNEAVIDRGSRIPWIYNIVGPIFFLVGALALRQVIVNYRCDSKLQSCLETPQD